VRLSSIGEGPLTWLAGAYFLDIDRIVGVNTGLDLGNGITNSLYVPQGGDNPTEQLVHDRFSNRVLAAFGELSYEMTETTEVSLALRFDSERREVENLVPVNALTQYIDCDGPPYTGGTPINPGLCPGVNPSGSIAPKSRTFSQLQPKLSLTWDVSEDWTLFGSAGVGFKSGGFNNQGAKATVDIFINGLINHVFLANLGLPPQANVGISDDVDKETSVSLELGAKGSLLNDRLLLEATVFNVQVDDMQFFEFLVGPFGLLRLNGNLDEVSLQGAEVGATWAATDILDLYAGWGYVDSEIEANSVRPDTVGNKSPYTPDWTASAGARIVMPLTGDWSLAASADWSAVGKTWFHVVQDQQRATLFEGAASDFTPTRRDSYSVLNLRVGVENDRFSAVVFAKNATEEVYLEEVIPAPEFGGTFIHPADLRRVGVELTARF
jgi:iron complex outermembrane receptor protein